MECVNLNFINCLINKSVCNIRLTLDEKRKPSGHGVDILSFFKKKYLSYLVP